MSARRLIRLLLAMAILLACTGVRAETCTASSATLSFGTINPVVSTAASVSTTITINCTANLLATVRVCIGLGPGDGQTAYAPRIAKNGSNPLLYNLYTTTGGATIWGNQASAASYAPVAVDIPTTLGSGSTTVTVYGRTTAGQTALTAGPYAATFSSLSQAAIVYREFNLVVPAPNCSTLTTPSSAFALNVTANVINDCTINATNIDFGTRGVLNSTLTASGTLSVTCTSGDPWSIALSAGTGAGASVLDRRMTRTGGTDVIKYGLYQTNAYATPWGDGSSGSTTATGTGTGVAQSIPVYARVLPQTTPRAGSYTDTIMATITY